MAATSARNVWAVGYTGGDCARPLIARWNGTAWRLRSPRRAAHAGDHLEGAAATSTADAWVAGYTARARTLILHWNGRGWYRTPSPNPLPAGRLNAVILTGVAAVSRRDAWVVGYYFNSDHANREKALIEHWNGWTWRRVPSPPAPRPDSQLLAVTATSASNAWAVGNSGAQALIEHWNGTAWRRVPSPGPGRTSNLFGVTATSARSAWAVGAYYGGGQKTLIEHWNGTAWRRVPSPNPPPFAGVGSGLVSVAAASARAVWAVGGTGGDGSISLIERWNGTAWHIARVRIPHLVAGWGLTAVAAASASSVWGVGATWYARPLIVHWDGTTWRRVPNHTCPRACAPGRSP